MSCTQKKYRGGVINSVTKRPANFANANNKIVVINAINQIKDVLNKCEDELKTEEIWVNVNKLIKNTVHNIFIPNLEFTNHDDIGVLLKKLTHAHYYIKSIKLSLDNAHIDFSPVLKDEIIKTDSLVVSEMIHPVLRNNPDNALHAKIKMVTGKFFAKFTKAIIADIDEDRKSILKEITHIDNLRKRRHMLILEENSQPVINNGRSHRSRKTKLTNAQIKKLEANTSSAIKTNGRSRRSYKSE